jgi:ubiquinone/menaquinone biosynthesis C-methylase UbiE
MKPVTNLIDGSPEGWEAIWKNELPFYHNRSCLFTRTSTKTIYEFWQRGYANDLISEIESKNYNELLELGSGRGTTSMYLSDAGYTQISMIDLSEQAKQLAEMNFTKFGLRFKDFISADVRRTGLPSDSYDCIYNIGLLEHFNQPAEVLNESYRLLRPGGMIFMPIFPDRIAPSSYVIRLFLNPLSYIKRIFSIAKNQNSEMTRTNSNPKDYLEICLRSGFQKAECLHYNPYPKIVRDGWYENKVVLNLYKAFHFLKKKNKKKFEFRTSSFFASGYLLIAYK